MALGSPDSRNLERIGDYRIVRVIGEGGMGIVYEAVERLSERRVALKVMHSNLARSADARARFFNEMRILAGLEHPNIVRSLACTEADGKLMMALEYLEGQTLRDELASTGPIHATRAVAIASAIASALVAAHERQPPIVHRDLKPENVMLLPDGSVRVMDFGIAKVLSDDAAVTRASQAVGTVLYMSPEQAESRPVTPQTDLYALGLILYEMLTGRALFDGPSIVSILRDHCETPPPPLPDVVRRVIPPDLERLLMQLLEKSPSTRPPSARHVLARFGAVEGVAAVPTERFAPIAIPPVHAATPAPRERPKVQTIELIERLDQRRRWPWVVGSIAVLVVGAAIAVPWTLYLQSRGEPKVKAKTAEAEEQTTSSVGQAPSAAFPSCAGALACAPFKPVDPSKVDFELAFAEATKLARSVAPNAQLWSISFLPLTAGPALDMTQPKARAFFHFDTAEGDLSVGVTGTELVATRTAIRKRPPLPAINCTFQRAFEAAIAGGFRQNEIHMAQLGTSPVSNAGQWLFLTDDVGSAQVDVGTCKLHRGPRRK